VELKAHSLHVTAELIRRYGELTNDDNPIHTDPDFAASTPLGTIIAHGTLSVNLIWRCIVDNLGPACLKGGALDVRFVAPVRVDDMVTASGRPQTDCPDVYEVWVMNQKGEKTITGTYTCPR
jgi:3-hydroxybutyryl-CoA dehydratase